jgi:hypothetical protein
VSLPPQLAMTETESLTLTAILRSSHTRDSYLCSELSFTTSVEVSKKADDGLSLERESLLHDMRHIQPLAMLLTGTLRDKISR